MRRLDVLVTAGVFGLSVGWAAMRAGLSPGARGRADRRRRLRRPVGTLVPQAPGRWSALHGLQLAALRVLPARIAEIETAGGVYTG
jgi:hypothetical protein